MCFEKKADIAEIHTEDFEIKSSFGSNIFKKLNIHKSAIFLKNEKS
jgi:hypothetical protein